MSVYVLHVLLLVISHVSSETKAEDICEKCDAPGTYLVEYCTQKNTTGDLILSNSCCINNTGAIIGVDLSNCSLVSVEGYFTRHIDLNVILLQENVGLKIKSADFRGLKSLEYLSLPLGLQCPGGNESWNETEDTADAHVCKEELDLCNKVSCPNTNSYCVMTEPGDVECLCKEGYHGYKCLRQGYFPTLLFVIALCSCTVILSGYLWCIQRRKVKRH